MLLGTRRYQGGSDGRIAIADASRNPTLLRWQRWTRLHRGCSFKRDRASNATLLRNHHGNAIPAPRSCILMTSASLKSVRNHCKTQNRAENGSETTTKRTILKKGLVRRFWRPPCHPPKNAKSFRNHTKRAIPMPQKLEQDDCPAKRKFRAQAPTAELQLTPSARRSWRLLGRRPPQLLGERWGHDADTELLAGDA